MANDIFISYSRRNKDFVKKLNDALREHGLDPWVDWEDIPPSVDWMEEIRNGIDEANTFIFVISPDSIHSKVCYEELQYAVDQHKRLVPILHMEVRISGERKGANALDQAYEKLGIETEPQRMMGWLGPHNWIFFREEDDFNAAVQTLLIALNTNIEDVRYHTYLLGEAKEWDSSNRSTAGLLRGEDLQTALAWMEQDRTITHVPDLNPLQLQFIQASQRADAVRKRIQLFTIGYTVALIALAVFAVVQLLRVQAANENEREANQQLEEQLNNLATAEANAVRNAAEARSLALIANALIAVNESDNDLAITLSILASQGSPERSNEAESVLAEAAYSPGTRARFGSHRNGVTALDLKTLEDDDPFDDIPPTIGGYVVSGGMDGLVRYWYWEYDEVTPAGQRFEGHDDAITDVIILPNETQILSSAANGSIILWDIASGDIVQQYATSDTPVQALALHPNGEQFFAGNANGQIILWNFDDETSVEIFTHNSGDAITTLSVSPTGEFFLSGHQSGDIAIWLVEQNSVSQVFNDHIGAVTSIALSPDGNTVASVSQDSVINLWDLRSTQIIQRLTGHDARVNTIVFDPNSIYLISGSEDNSVVVWLLETGKLLHQFRGHDDAINDVVIDSFGEFIISASSDETMRVWDIFDSQLIAIIDDYETAILDVDVYDELILSIRDNNGFEISHVETSELLQDIPFEDNVWHGRFLPGGEQVVLALENGTVLIFDLITERTVQEFEVIHTAPIYSLDINNDHMIAATGGADGNVVIWDLETGDALRVFEDVGDEVYAVALHPNGREIFTSDSDNSILSWDIETGQNIYSYTGHTDTIYSLDISLNGAKMVSGSRDEKAILWDLNTNEFLVSLEGHNNAVRVVRFNTNDDLVLTGGEDGSLRIWNSKTGVEIRYMQDHVDWITNAAFSQHNNNNYIVSGSWDNTVRIWRLDTLAELIEWVCENRYVRELTVSEQNRLQIRQDASRQICNITRP